MSESGVVTYMKDPTVPKHTGSTVSYRVLTYLSKQACVNGLIFTISIFSRIPFAFGTFGDYPTRVEKLPEKETGLPGIHM